MKTTTFLLQLLGAACIRQRRMKLWLHGVTVVRRPMYMSDFPHPQHASKARLDMLDTIHGVTGMRASNVCVGYFTLTTSVDSSLDCRFCHRLSSTDVPLCHLLLRSLVYL